MDDHARDRITAAGFIFLSFLSVVLALLIVFVL
jgi:hypothetical protein